MVRAGMLGGDRARMTKALGSPPDGLTLRTTFGSRSVYEVTPGPPPESPDVADLLETLVASASIGAGATAPFAADGLLSTAFTTGRPQEPAAHLDLALAARHQVAGVRLVERVPEDYPRGLRVSVSDDARA